MYEFPKIHKIGKKIRLIISNVNALSYQLAKWVFNELKKLTNSLSVTNSFDFANKIKGIKKVKCERTYDDGFVRLGSPVSKNGSLLSQYPINNVQCQRLLPHVLWLRYVDDIFAIVEKDSIQKIFDTVEDFTFI